MKRVYELKVGDVIRFPFGSHANLIKVEILEIEKYTTWSRIWIKEYGGNVRLWTWLNTDAMVEVFPNDEG